MSENKNPLNDFLEMEENGTDAFADLPLPARMRTLYFECDDKRE